MKNYEALRDQMRKSLQSLSSEISDSIVKASEKAKELPQSIEGVKKILENSVNDLMEERHLIMNTTLSTEELVPIAKYISGEHIPSIDLATALVKVLDRIAEKKNAGPEMHKLVQVMKRQIQEAMHSFEWISEKEGFDSFKSRSGGLR